jgi:hypothetical protein
MEATRVGNLPRTLTQTLVGRLQIGRWTPGSAHELAGSFQCSPEAVAGALAELTGAGLLTVDSDGRHHGRRRSVSPRSTGVMPQTAALLREWLDGGLLPLDGLYPNRFKPLIAASASTLTGALAWLGGEGRLRYVPSGPWLPPGVLTDFEYALGVVGENLAARRNGTRIFVRELAATVGLSRHSVEEAVAYYRTYESRSDEEDRRVYWLDGELVAGPVPEPLRAAVEREPRNLVTDEVAGLLAEIAPGAPINQARLPLRTPVRAAIVRDALASLAGFGLLVHDGHGYRIAASGDEPGRTKRLSPPLAVELLGVLREAGLGPRSALAGEADSLAGAEGWLRGAGLVTRRSAHRLALTAAGRAAAESLA